jgi:hypothetical protein
VKAADVTSETSAQGKKSSGSSTHPNWVHTTTRWVTRVRAFQGVLRTARKKFNGSIEFLTPSTALLIQLYSTSARQLIYKIRREKKGKPMPCHGLSVHVHGVLMLSVAFSFGCLSYKPYFFTKQIVFFSHNKLTNSTFSQTNRVRPKGRVMHVHSR